MFPGILLKSINHNYEGHSNNDIRGYRKTAGMEADLIPFHVNTFPTLSRVRKVF